MEAVAELPGFFEVSDWRKIPLPEPPGPNRTKEELEELLDLQTRPEREDRRREIISEQTSICPYFDRLLMFSTHPGNYVLMEAMFQLGTIVACHYKKRFMRPRPSQLEPRLRPLINVPAHASYPSGHALQYFLVAKALTSVVHNHDIGSELFLIANRVATNREFAGVHYPTDTHAGELLAHAIFPQVQSTYIETFQVAAREWL
jgi:hypothetical protein